MRLTEILKQDQDLNNFIAKTKQVKNSLITGANAGAFSLLLKQIVSEPNAPLILIEENEIAYQVHEFLLENYLNKFQFYIIWLLDLLLIFQLLLLQH